MKFFIASDIHVTRKKGMSHHIDEFEKVLLEDKNSTLIIPGDLTSYAREKEYELVSDWFLRLIEQGISIVLAVGNHDMAQSILLMRLPRKRGYERYSRLADLIAKQSIVIARRDEFDLIYKIDKDVFYAPRTTHTRPWHPTRIKREQFEWAYEELHRRGLYADNGYRLHLVTHQSLWKRKGDTHNHMHKRKRIVKEFLQPIGFSTAINGHNHRFDAGYREIKELGFSMYHIQAPTLSSRTKMGQGQSGYVLWSPDDPSSATLVSAN